MLKITLIAAGGAFGTVLRYTIAGWSQRLSDTFPIGTLTVNVAGCLVIGFLASALTGPLLGRDEYRMALLIGVLGGFTTFSSFGLETYRLLTDGQYATAILYVTLSNVLGLAAVWVGDRLGTSLFGLYS